MSKSAGRVLMIPQGEYDAAKQYEILDLVSYEGIGYICKQRTLGNIPTNTNFWQPNGALTDPHKHFVTPEMFGAKGDGVTDDTAAVAEALTHDYVVGNGVYAISSPIYAQLNRQAYVALELKAIATMDYVLWLDAKGSTWGDLVKGDFNISINCNLLASDGLRIDRFRASNIKIEVKNFTGNAASIRHTGNLACGENYVQLDASNLDTAETVSANAVGLCCGQDDIYSVVCANVKTAVKLRHGGNKFNYLHAWSSSEAWFLNSAMVEFVVDDENIIDTFICDTIQVLFKMDNSQSTRYPKLDANNLIVYNNSSVTTRPIYVWWLKSLSSFSPALRGLKLISKAYYNNISWGSGTVPNILVGDSPTSADITSDALGSRCSVINLSGLAIDNLDLDYVYNCTDCYYRSNGVSYNVSANNENLNLITQTRMTYKQAAYRMRPSNVYTWASYPWMDIANKDQVLAKTSSMPTASEDYLNMQYLYVGGTNANYTKGKIYECRASGTAATYSWVEL